MEVIKQNIYSFGALLNNRIAISSLSTFYLFLGCDIDGVRTLKIENPFSTFKPMDPTMTKYLEQKRQHAL